VPGENSIWENNVKTLKNQYPGLLEEITCAGEKEKYCTTEDTEFHGGKDNFSIKTPCNSATSVVNSSLLASPIKEESFAPDEIKIITASSGDPTLCVKGVNIHSGRDPAREGLRLAQVARATQEGAGGTVVILGFGLGYTASAVAEMSASDKSAGGQGGAPPPIIIVEKHRELLVKAFETRDLSDFLSKNRIIFVVGGTGEGITNALSIADGFISAGEKTEPVVIRNRALVDLDKEWYGVIEEKIRTWSMRDDVNSATLKRFGKRWVRNLSRNMSAIRDYAGISRLANIANEIAENAPVFLAAAGPSLDKVRHLLREIHKRFITVAVDTSFRFFTDNGIQPDFVLVVDPQFWNSRHLDRCPYGNTALIAESAVYPPVLNLPFKNIFLCGSLFPLGSFVEKQVDPKGALGAGGSVSTTAWDFARTLGSKEIWIAGLDLAFPDFKTHFRGAVFETRANAASNRFSPAETWVARALRDGFPFNAPCAAGGQVLTDRRLSLYAAWFENRFRMHPEVKNFGVFQEGLAIAGIQAADTETLLSLPERRSEIDKKLAAAFSRIEGDFNNSAEKQKRAERYAKAKSALIGGLEEVRNAAKKGAEITHRALNGKTDSAAQNKILKELDEITRRITESEVKEVAGFLFPPAENKTAASESASENKNSPKDSFRAYLESLHKLFSSLAQTVDFNLENLK